MGLYDIKYERVCVHDCVCAFVGDVIAVVCVRVHAGVCVSDRI